MIREEASAWAKIYQAYAEGKTIQHRTGIQPNHWRDLDNPGFGAPVSCYRIKPEVPAKRYQVVVNDETGELSILKAFVNYKGKTRLALIDLVVDDLKGFQIKKVDSHGAE